MGDAEEIAKLEYQLAQANVERKNLEVQLSKAAEVTQLELLKIRTQNSAFIHEVISQLEPFTGTVGDLEHFLKGGDQIKTLIVSRKDTGTLSDSDIALLEASLVSRISRRVLNAIQGDTTHSWETLKARLKRLYGGGRWTPEEDAFYLIKERRSQGQSEGAFAEKMLVMYNRLVEKMVETVGQAEGSQRLELIKGILKVQLNHYIDRPGSLPRDRDFLECVHDIIDAHERKESRLDKAEGGWVEIKSQRRRQRSPPRQNTGERRFEKRHARGSEERKRRPERRCYECNKTGHVAAQCRFAICFECGRQGHFSRECPRRKPRGNRRDQPEPMEVNHQRWRDDRSHRRCGERDSSGDSSEEGSLRSERSTLTVRRHQVRGDDLYKGGAPGADTNARQLRTE